MTKISLVLRLLLSLAAICLGIAVIYGGLWRYREGRSLIYPLLWIAAISGVTGIGVGAPFKKAAAGGKWGLIFGFVFPWVVMISFYFIVRPDG